MKHLDLPELDYILVCLCTNGFKAMPNGILLGEMLFGTIGLMNDCSFCRDEQRDKMSYNDSDREKGASYPINVH